MNLEKIIYPYYNHEGINWENLEIVKGDGVFLYDIKGKKYFDFHSGYSTVSIGYNNKQIIGGVKNSEIYGYLPPTYYNKYTDILGQYLLNISGCVFDTILRTVSGSETVDLSVQISYNYNNKTKCILFGDSYHGNTYIFSNYNNGNIIHFYYNKSEILKMKKEIILLLSKGDISCVLVEGFSTTYGYFYDIDFIKFLRKITNKFGILLIFDGIADSFGKVGYTFTYQYYGIIPDIVCLGKGLSSGYSPIGGILTNRKILKNFQYYSTYGWTPLSCIISHNVLKQHCVKKLNQNAISIGNKIFDILNKELDFKKVKKIYGSGCIIFIEFFENLAYDIYNKSLDENLLVVYEDYSKNLIKLMPQQISDINIIEVYLKKLVNIINKN